LILDPGADWRFAETLTGWNPIEYAWMAGFVAVAARAITSGASSSIGKIFRKVSSVTTAAAG
jgi:Flp pilus assembly pilin Flp